jgi:type VI secretion system protein ImpA
MNSEPHLLFYSEHDEFTDTEFTDDFQRIDNLISAYDSQGEGPLRKGEQAFQWSVVEAGTRQLLRTSPDLRVAIWFLRANLSQYGLQGFFEGIAVLAELMRLPKQRLFPVALDDESPREIHAIALAWLASPRFIFGLRTARVDKHSNYTLADLISSPDLSGTFKNAKAILTNINISLSHLGEIANALAEDDDYLDYGFTEVMAVLSKAALCFGENVTRSVKTTVVSSEVEGLDLTSKAPKSREEMSQLLILIIDYFKVNEPSHPAPILLTRVQRMMGASFEEIMAELYPEATSLIARIDKPQAS